jgi:4-amino-4-deoxy-L-arabinose transferase-like glycosyltransferase
MKNYLGPIILILACVALFMVNTWDLSMLKGDENYYFSSARRMIREGDWITPRYHHHIRYEKPVLYYWLVALFFKLFGVSWWVARLTSVIFGALTALLVYLMALRFFSKKTAYLSAAVLATSFLFFKYSRLAVIDITFIFLVTLSLFLFIKAERDKRRGLFALAAVPLGLSVMAKGPLGLVVIALTVLSYIIATGKYRVLKETNPLLGLAIILAITLPWPVMMYRIHGAEYLSHLWEVEMVDKAVGSVPAAGDPGNLLWAFVKYIGYYIPVVLFSFAPWSLFLPFALFGNIGAKRREDALFILSWFWSVFIFFTLISFKHTHYMLLLSPPLAILTADLFTRKEGLKRISLAIVALSAAFYLALTVFLLPALDDGALKMLSLKLATEIDKQDEEVGVASKGLNLKKIGIHLNNLVSSPRELSGDDLAQYRRVNKKYASSFLDSKERVFLFITRSDYERHVPGPVRERYHILSSHPMWRRLKLKKYVSIVLGGKGETLKEEAYLISNRRE